MGFFVSGVFGLI